MTRNSWSVPTSHLTLKPVSRRVRPRTGGPLVTLWFRYDWLIGGRRLDQQTGQPSWRPGA